MFFAAVALALITLLLPTHVRSQELNINNYCEKDVYFWDVGAKSSKPLLITPGDYGQFDLQPDPITKGKDVFISWSNATDLSQPTLHFSFNVVGDWAAQGHVLWYAIANVNGVPFKGHQVRVDAPSCTKILWQDGEGDNGVKNCLNAQFMDLRLCVER